MFKCILNLRLSYWQLLFLRGWSLYNILTFWITFLNCGYRIVLDLHCTYFIKIYLILYNWAMTISSSNNTHKSFRDVLFWRALFLILTYGITSWILQKNTTIWVNLVYKCVVFLNHKTLTQKSTAKLISIVFWNFHISISRFLVTYKYKTPSLK